MAQPSNSAATKLIYYIIIKTVDESKLAQSIPVFAQHFLVDPAVAEQIFKSAPIVFLAEISRREFKTIKPRLLEVSKLGIEFMVTTKSPSTVSRVLWSSKPYYAEAGGKLVRYVDFQWRGNAFVCPNCGETFLFQRIGNPLARFVKAKEADESVSASKAVPPGKETVKKETEQVAELAPVAEDSSSQVMELTPIEVEEPEEAEEGVPEPVDILAGSDTAAQEVSLEQAEPTEAVPELPETIEVAPQTEAAHNVFLSKITSPSKKEEAVKLIAETKGISLEEAKKLAGRVLIPLVKEVTEEEAKGYLERFKKIGVSGRITKITKK